MWLYVACMLVIKAEFFGFPEEPEINVSTSGFRFPLGFIKVLSSHQPYMLLIL